MTTVVSCDQVSKSFARKTLRVQAMQDVTLQLGRGEFVAIRGKSGCGKSTLLLTLGGLQRPDSGAVRISDQAIYDLQPEQRAGFRAQHIGFVFQQFHLIPYLTVYENVIAARLGLRDSTGLDASEQAKALIERVGLSSRHDHKPAELSIGECQRAAIARALMNRPSLILADEPTGNLDEENTGIVLKALREIASDGTTVLLVTHDAQCEQFVDRCLRMEAGTLVA